MGCSAAKNLTVEPIDGCKITQLSSNGLDETRKISIPRRTSDVPPIVGEDPQTELLETANVNNIQKTPHGLSFEIAFEEQNDESIIKKHPPKRFQKLEDLQTSPPVTLVKLQEKLDEAEIRRQQILQQRIQSAKYRNNLKKQNSVTSTLEDDQMNHLKVPPDIPQPANPYDVRYI